MSTEFEGDAAKLFRLLKMAIMFGSDDEVFALTIFAIRDHDEPTPMFERLRDEFNQA
jgi:hypothetical protein